MHCQTASATTTAAILSDRMPEVELESADCEELDPEDPVLVIYFQ